MMPSPNYYNLPNIVDVTSIVGQTRKINLTTSNQSVVDNPQGSNAIYRINSIRVCNYGNSQVTAHVTAVIIDGGGISYQLVELYPVTWHGTEIILSKDTGIYLMPYDSLKVLADANSQVSMMVTFDMVGTLPSVKGSGYVVGGFNSSSQVLATVYKYAFTTESGSALDLGLIYARKSSAGYANSGVAGYTTGGENSSGTTLASIEKLAFPEDFRFLLYPATLTTGVIDASGFADSGVAGYTAGGKKAAGLAAITDVDKLVFSNETAFKLGSGLGTAVWLTASFANSGTAGYVAGGGDTEYAGSTRIQKYTFATDTMQTIMAALSSNTYGAAGFSNNGVAGYVVGVPNDLALAKAINKITFSTDTRTTLSETLATQTKYAVGFANSGTAGYVYGGQNTATGEILGNINKIVFPTDTISSADVGLTPVYYAAGFANSGVL